MLKNRLKALAETKFDSAVKAETIKDNELLNVRGGLAQKAIDKDVTVCGALTDCNINSADCPKLQSCGWN